MGETAINFTPQEKAHIEIMQAVVKDFSDLPIVLKGGTALLLCYGLDRFSEDLDFDANKKLNLSSRIQKVLSRKTQDHTINIAKNTDTVQRLKIHYIHEKVSRLLKVEVSFRDTIQDNEIVEIKGIKTYKVSRLIEQKINALLNRTKARDLYDVNFLIKNFSSHFSNKAIEQLNIAVANMNHLEARFKPAFADDDLVDEDELVNILLSIEKSLENLNHI
ncbi:MAG: nucleotidyl transferase AbiEii/AbiGii toxin family protein [Bacteroidia bacterium]|nr:MAG: nucleotidyl transferase AbiEii/AbiGii toxin family protein [Bacteroidia bacterium]